MTDNRTDAAHTDPPLFEVGRVVKPHGLNGEVSVFVQTDRPEVRFAPGVELLVGGQPMTVASSRPHQGRWLVRFEGYGDRTAAERLRQKQLEAPPLEGDEDSDTFWVHELVGLTVVTEDSEDLGDVVDVIELPASAGYDLLEVKRVTGETWFLPAADDLVEAVETEDGDLVLVVMDPPAGLVDEAEQEVVRPANQPGAGGDDQRGAPPPEPPAGGAAPETPSLPADWGAPPPEPPAGGAAPETPSLPADRGAPPPEPPAGGADPETPSLPADRGAPPPEPPAGGAAAGSA